MDDPELTRREVLGVAGALGVAAGASTAADAGAPAAPDPSKPAEPRIDVVCRSCGSRNVGRDPWADWDVAAQDRVLGAAFDDAFCHDCETKTRLEDVEA